MKKQIVMLLLYTLTLIISTPVYAETLFYDGFESGNISGWDVASGSYTRSVTALNPAIGSNSFTQTGGASQPNDGISMTLPSITPTYISFHAKSAAMTSTSQANTYFVVGDDTGSSDSAVILFSFFEGSIGVATDSNTFQSAGPYSINTWYKIEFKNINWTTKTYDLYVDNVLKISAIPFRSQSTPALTKIFLFNYTAAQVWYDEILMEDSAPDPPPIATITSITPNPANLGELISMTGSSFPSYTGYEWSAVRLVSGSPQGGTTLLGATSSLKINSLSLGDYRISYKVKNASGVWSNITTQDIAVVKQATADLQLSQGSVSYINSTDQPVINPQVGDNIKVRVAVSNSGELDANNEITVSAYNGAAIPANLIGEATVPSIKAGELSTVNIPWTVTSGCKIVTVTAQFTDNIATPGTVSESSSQNNTTTSALVVGNASLCTGGIDVTTALSTQTLRTNSLITVSGSSFYSSGASPVMGANVTLSLSDGRSFTSKTTAPNGTYAISFSLPGASGDYTATISLFDGNRSGSAVIPLHVVTAPQAAELIPKQYPYYSCGISFTGPKVYKYGERSVVNTDVTLNAIITNAGNANAGPFTVKFFDGPPASGILIGTVSDVSVNSGASTTVSTITPWLPTVAQDHSIYVQVDSENGVSESNELNNECTKALSVRPDLPNLRPSVSFSNNPVTGETATLFADIYNDAPTQLTDGSFDVSFYADAIDAPHLIGTVRLSNETISYGAKVTASLPWSTVAAATGYHYIHAVVDAAGEVAEADEVDNNRYNKIDVYTETANPYLQNVQFSNDYPANKSAVTLYATIKNRGGTTASNQVVDFYNGDPVVGGVKIGSAQSGIFATGVTVIPSSAWTTPDINGSIKIYATLNGQKVSRTMQVHIGPRPDLAVYSAAILYTPKPASTNDTVAVSANIVNNGVALTTPTSYRLATIKFFVDDAWLDSVYLSSLGSGATVNVSSTRTFTLVNNQHKLSVEIIPGDQGDANSDDNQATTTILNGSGPPIASAGSGQNVAVGTLVNLNGSGSQGALSYLWQFKTVPAGSSAIITNQTSPNPTFVPDLAGVYVVELTAANGAGSGSASVTIAAAVDVTAPVTTPSLGSGPYSGVQMVTLTCSDVGGAGCASTKYCLGNSCTPITNYSGAISINTSTALTFMSTDLVGLSEAPVTRSYTIISSAPTVTTNLASNVSQTTATLNGIVNENAATASVTFEFGLTTSYGSTASAGNLNSGSGTTAVNKAIYGLNCNTTYHYRVTALNSAGATNGNDAAFTTAICPAMSTALNYTSKVGSVFTLYRLDPKGDATPIYSGAQTSYNDTSLLLPNTVYQYVVTSDIDPTLTSLITIRTPLYKGWNIVGVPYNTAGVPLSSLFSTPVSAAYQWISRSNTNPDINGDYATVSTLNPGLGYFIKPSSSSDTMLAYSGTLNTLPLMVTLKPGWTLISNPTASNMSGIGTSWLVDSLPLNVAVNAGTIGGDLYWWNGSTYDSWKIDNLIFPWNSAVVEPWKAYWILNLDAIDHTLTIQ